MHNTWTELLLTLNDSDATHFCVAPTARKGASYDLTLAALGKKRKKAARGVRFKSGLGLVLSGNMPPLPYPDPMLSLWVLDKHFLQWIPYDPLWSQSSVCIKLLKCAFWPESNMNQYIIQCTKAIYWVLITFNKLQSHTHPTWCFIVTTMFKVVS